MRSACRIHSVTEYASKRRLKHIIWSTLFLSLVLRAPVNAQQILGAITGTVLDSSGAAVPGATVKATNIATNLEVTEQSQSNGTYVIQNLPAGTYKLTFTKEGFAIETHTEILVNANRTTTVDGALQPGSVSSTVEVTATPLMNQVDTTNGYVVDQLTIQETPLGTGSFTQLAILSPGVHADFLGGGGSECGPRQSSHLCQRPAGHQQQFLGERHQHQQSVQRQLDQPGWRESLCSKHWREVRPGRRNSDRYFRVCRNRSISSHAAAGGNSGNCRQLRHVRRDTGRQQRRAHQRNYQVGNERAARADLREVPEQRL